jgi:hypothetical protein
VVLLCAGALLTACSGESDTEGAGAEVAGDTRVRVEALSTRPEMVTGGDVLLAVDATEVEEVSVGGRPVPVTFESDDEGRSLGLVSDLPQGASTIEVRTPEGRGELDVVDHPRNGPVFSGERLPMTVCTTHNFGLAAAVPPECLAETVVSFGWITADGEIVTVADPSLIPAEKAAKVELDGVERPAAAAPPSPRASPCWAPPTPPCWPTATPSPRPRSTPCRSSATTCCPPRPP